MQPILQLTAFLLSGFITNAQSRKAGKGQQDFLVVTTDTAKRKSAVVTTGSKPADNPAGTHNRAVLQKTNRTKKN